MVVTGGSAGGHLAALLALEDGGVQACVPFYGVYDLTDDSGLPMARRRLRFLERVVMKRTIAAHRDDFERASPTFCAGEHAPPFFVIHGRNDSLVPVAETRRFVAPFGKCRRRPSSTRSCRGPSMRSTCSRRSTRPMS